MITVTYFLWIPGKSLRHVSSGMCVHPLNGGVFDGVKLVLWKGCDEDKLVFHFLVQGRSRRIKE